MSAADQTYSVQIGAAGTGTVTITPNTKARTWVVSQVSVELTGAPVGSACVLRKNGALITYLVASGDAAGGDPPVTLYGADQLTVAWTGCTSGQVGRVFVIYQEEANR